MKAKIGALMLLVPVGGVVFWALMQVPWLVAVCALGLVLWVLVALALIFPD